MMVLDESIALLVAAGCAAAGAAVGVWWKRRRSDAASPRQLDRAQTARIEERFDRLETLAETMAVEIERMSEGQRFTTKLLLDRSASPAPSPIVPDPARQPTPH